MFRLVSTPPRQRRPRVRSKRYLQFIASLPCVITGARPVECAHVRYGEAKYDKRQTGAGEKPSDIWALPLSAEMHRLSDEAQHQHGERQWWEGRGIDPLELCVKLQRIYDTSPTRFYAIESAWQLLKAYR